MAEARERRGAAARWWQYRHCSSAAIAMPLGLVLGAGPASAGGLYIQEFGTPAMGAAEAGGAGPGERCFDLVAQSRRHEPARAEPDHERWGALA